MDWEALPVEMQQRGLAGDLDNIDDPRQPFVSRLNILRTQTDNHRRLTLLCRRRIPAFRQGQPQFAALHAGLAIALLVLMVCSSVGGEIKRFWPRHFFVMFYAVHLAVLGIVV